MGMFRMPLEHQLIIVRPMARERNNAELDCLGVLHLSYHLTATEC